MGTVVGMTASPSVYKILHPLVRNIDNTKYLCSYAICDAKLLTKTTPRYSHCVVLRKINKNNGCARTHTEGLIKHKTVLGNSNFSKACDCATKNVT